MGFEFTVAGPVAPVDPVLPEFPDWALELDWQERAMQGAILIADPVLPEFPELPEFPDVAELPLLVAVPGVTRVGVARLGTGAARGRTSSALPL